jgi:hypothetical protein
VSLELQEGAYSYGASSPTSKAQEEPSGIIPEELDVGTVQDDPVSLRGLKRPSFTEVAKATPVIFSNA